MPSIPTGNVGRNHICRAYNAAYYTSGSLQPIMVTNEDGNIDEIFPPAPPAS